MCFHLHVLVPSWFNGISCELIKLQIQRVENVVRYLARVENVAQILMTSYFFFFIYVSVEKSVQIQNYSNFDFAVFHFLLPFSLHLLLRLLSLERDSPNTKDLGEVSDKILNQQIREASERWGCFRVINHGVPLCLMSDMKKTVMDLFERPYEVKVRNTDVLLGSGYRAPNEINPYYEALGLYDMASSQAVNTFCDQLEASADQRLEIMVKYAKAIDGLAKDLARRLAESYGLAETNFFKGWPSQFRINKYHFQPETVGKLGVQLHTDSGFLTILQDDENVGGLEAMDHSSGTFFPISPLPNTLAINLGDMAAIWSNGRLCNVKHRVQCNEATKRFSIASFLLGPMDTDLEPPSEFVDAEHPRLYKPISHDGVRNIRMTTKLHDGEALKLITYDE
ncbi:unnamed protein product [Brassica napus]|uniref:2-oxoglutarate-dependent dioxygenase DAO n=1 Tax=Brassica napus TaxID=3708 RepID=A0A816UCW3_BRANA|nr:unnamed protein product [Brassica napus]